MTNIRNVAKEFGAALQKCMIRPGALTGESTATTTSETCNECVGAVFVAFADRFKHIYPDYVVAHDLAIEHLAKVHFCLKKSILVVVS